MEIKNELIMLSFMNREFKLSGFGCSLIVYIVSVYM